MRINTQKMKTMKVKKIYIPLIMFVFSVQAFSQDDLEKEVMVVEDYQPVIQDVDKISTLPAIDDTVKVVPSFNYSILPKVVKTEFELRQIKPAKMVGVQEPLLYKSYLKLGAGNTILPLAEFYIHNLTSKEYSVGASFKHKNSDTRVTLLNEEKVKAGFSDTDIGLYGKKFFSSGTLFGNLDFTSNKVFYYGYNTSDTLVLGGLEKKDIKQNYFNLRTNIGFESLNKQKQNWIYNLSAYHDFFGDKYQYNENEIGLNTDIGKMFGNQYISFESGFQYIIPNEELDSFSTSFLELKPVFEKESEEWKVTLGINSYIIQENDNVVAYFYPVAKLNFNIYKEVLAAYIGIKGDAKTNSYRELALTNPYIQPGQVSIPEKTPFNAFAGLQGNISKSVSFNVYGAALRVKDISLFINDTVGTLGNMFLVITDDVDITKIYGELNIDPSKKFKLQLKGCYYNYLTDKEMEAWHKPNFDVSLSARYNLQDKFLLNANIYGVGTRYALNVNDRLNPIELKPYIDANLGFEYRYTHLLSFFIDFHNLSASSYEIWNQFPANKLGVIAGFTYAL